MVQAGKAPLILDVTVHGDSTGLHLHRDTEYKDRASFGFVLNHIQKKCGNHNVLVLFESCYAGRAYRNTIRGSVPLDASDRIENYANLPNFPVYGAGDNFATAGGPVMFCQYQHNFRKWWVDLREYDPKGMNRAIHPIETRDRKTNYSATETSVLLFIEGCLEMSQ